MKLRNKLAPNLKKRSYLLPRGYKNLSALLPAKKISKKEREKFMCKLRTNSQILAKEVRVWDLQHNLIGILPISEAMGEIVTI